MSAVIKADSPLQPVTQDSALMAVLSKALDNPAFDVEKMERLLVMYERIADAKKETAFNAAMADCQKAMGPVSADASNPQTNSKYASYAKLDKAVRPIYTGFGFALSFDEGTAEKPDHVRVLCYCTHREGHKVTYHADMPADGLGLKGNAAMTKTHATGSAKTYGKRYLLKDIFNIAVGEGDTDGNGTITRISEKQVADIEALITEVNAKRDAFMRYYKLAKLEDIPVASYATIVKSLEAKRRKAS